MAAEKEAEVEEDDEELTRDANTSRWAGYIFFLRGMGPTASMLTLFVITLCSACKAAFQGYLKGQFSRASLSVRHPRQNRSDPPILAFGPQSSRRLEASLEFGSAATALSASLCELSTLSAKSVKQATDIATTGCTIQASSPSTSFSSTSASM